MFEIDVISYYFGHHTTYYLDYFGPGVYLYQDRGGVRLPLLLSRVGT